MVLFDSGNCTICLSKFNCFRIKKVYFNGRGAFSSYLTANGSPDAAINGTSVTSTIDGHLSRLKPRDEIFWMNLYFKRGYFNFLLNPYTGFKIVHRNNKTTIVVYGYNLPEENTGLTPREFAHNLFFKLDDINYDRICEKERVYIQRNNARWLGARFGIFLSTFPIPYDLEIVCHSGPKPYNNVYMVRTTGKKINTGLNLKDFVYDLLKTFEDIFYTRYMAKPVAKLEKLLATSGQPQEGSSSAVIEEEDNGLESNSYENENDNAIQIAEPIQISLNNLPEIIRAIFAKPINKNDSSSRKIRIKLDFELPQNIIK